MKNESNVTEKQHENGEALTENESVSTTLLTALKKAGRKPRHNLTQQELMTFVTYDPDTGEFTRISTRQHTRWEGKRAGSDYKNYTRISVNGMLYLAHRLAWLYMTGEFPTCEIDHINRNPLDNRWCNLRLATSTQQKANTKVHRDTYSGLKGVSWFKRDSKWRAYGRRGDKQIHLGYFDSKEEAYEAYKKFALNEYGEYANV